MTTATADAALNVPTNLHDLTMRDLRLLAERMFPRSNAITNIWFRLLVNWRKASYRDNCGTVWLVKTADEFLSELPYSKATLYRTLRTFEELGLIVKRQAKHIYRYVTGKDHCNWIALRFGGKGGYGPRRCLPKGCACPVQASDATLRENAEAKQFVEPAQPTSDEQYRVEEKDAQCFDHMTEAKCVDHIPPSGNCSKENSSADAEAGENSNFAEGSQEGLSPEKTSNAAENSMTEKPGKKSLDEILASRKEVEAKKQEDQKDLPLKAVEAVRILQSARRGVWQHEPPMSASAKDGALLKQFIEKMRALKFTDAQIRATLREVVLGWDRFRAQVKSRTGRNLPERPQPITFTWQFDEVVVFIRENGFTSEPTSGTVEPAKSMSSLFGKK